MLQLQDLKDQEIGTAKHAKSSTFLTNSTVTQNAANSDRETGSAFATRLTGKLDKENIF